MAPTPGMLYVTMQPKPSLPEAQFHDWYNNEHGPLRVRFPFCLNGFRYRATDLDGSGKGNLELDGKGAPEWLAMYDVTDMEELTKPSYTRLRLPDVKSQREKDTMAQIAVNRKMYDLIASRQSPGFQAWEELGKSADPSPHTVISVIFTVKPGQEEALYKWYDGEHSDMLQKVPGWLRSRRYKTSYIEPPNNPEDSEYLALHEYAPDNGLDGPEFQAATSTPWRDEIYKSVLAKRARRIYAPYYIFGPAPRDLAALASPDAVSQFVAPEGDVKAASASAGGPTIESYITTPDGVNLAYRLEGAADDNAPLIVLSNSILVEWGIWDAFISAFFSKPENKKYRILRYHTRGRTSAVGDTPVTLDVLSKDVISLLDALRVPKAAAVIGVSLGGATALNAGLKHPDRVAKFVASDTNAMAPPGNHKAWNERAAVAEKEGAKAGNEPIIGQELAELTVRRWFAKESYDGGAMEKEIGRVKKMVEGNSLEGFKKSVQALFEYDVREEMKSPKVPGAFVVGAADGVLPGTMKEMASSYGSGAEFKVVESAGHLPMVEKPKEVADFVTGFLSK